MSSPTAFFCSFLIALPIDVIWRRVEIAADEDTVLLSNFCIYFGVSGGSVIRLDAAISSGMDVFPALREHYFKTPSINGQLRIYASDKTLLELQFDDQDAMQKNEAWKQFHRLFGSVMSDVVLLPLPERLLTRKQIKVVDLWNAGHDRKYIASKIGVATTASVDRHILEARKRIRENGLNPDDYIRK